MFRNLPSALLLLCAIAFAQHTQAQAYKLTTTTETYTELSNATDLSGTADSFEYDYVLDLPMKFKFFGFNSDFSSSSTQVYMVRDGYIASDQEFDNKVTMISYAGFAHLERNDATSSESYIVEGMPGERILKFQWKNMKLVGNPAGDFMNMQVWFHEKDNSISYHYGAGKASGKAAFYGNNGPSVGLVRAKYDFSMYYNVANPGGNPASPVYHEDKTGVYPLSGLPASGTVYTLSPVASAGIGHVAAALFEMSLFPNPVGNTARLNYTIAEGGQANISILDMSGRLIKTISNTEMKIGPGQTEINTESLNPGMYMIRLQSGNNSGILKFVK